MSLTRATVLHVDEVKRVDISCTVHGVERVLRAVPTLYGYDPVMHELVAVDLGHDAESSLVLGAIYNA